MQRAIKISTVLYRNNLKRILPNQGGRLVYFNIIQMSWLGCICSPGSVGKSPCCLMVAASISRGHGDPSDAEAGTQQRATASTTAASQAGPRIDRPLHRKPNGIPTGSIANKSESSPSNNNIGCTKQLQLKQILEPINPPTLPNASCSQMYFRHKRFKLPWHNTRTALTTLFGKNNSYPVRKQHRHKKSWISIVLYFFFLMFVF